MNRTLPLILTAALLLTACASAVPAQPADATTSPDAAASSPAQPDAAASSPSQPAAETSAPPLTPKFPVGHLLTLPQSQTSGPVWNTGDALYELRDASNMTPEALVLKTDYAALTQSVYCDIPGCTHDSDACPAYLASDFCVGVMAVDGTVYTYPGELTNVAPTQIYRIDPATGKTPVAAVPDALPHHMQLQWCDEYALYGCPLAASHQPGTLYRWDWQNDTVQTIPMLADEKIIACEGSRFLTIRIEANEPFPNFGSTEQEKAILAHAVYVYAWLDPATGAREKICTRPYADGYFHNYYDGRIELIALHTAQEIWDAIYLLKVRGAPAIGVAAALGIYLLANRIETEDFEKFYEKFTEYKEYLDSSRPTAVNLSWALKRMNAVAVKAGREEHKTVAEVKEILHDEALQIRAEDVEVCRKIGEFGLELVKPGDGILTHCNAGQLATVKYGTATAPIYLGQEKGYNFHVFADETRPLLQGARLTAFELHSAGVDVTLICDNMSASVMSKGWVQAVFVGCDRVAANGDTANKIGTSVVAAVAKQYGVPVYICAPTSTIDMATATGADICIEQRKAEEVTEMWYKERMAPEGVKVYNPAFDVTDHELIAGIVTEYGVARAPYTESLKEIMERKAQRG